jgi:hypothetical protein
MGADLGQGGAARTTLRGELVRGGRCFLYLLVFCIVRVEKVVKIFRFGGGRDCGRLDGNFILAHYLAMGLEIEFGAARG